MSQLQLNQNKTGIARVQPTITAGLYASGDVIGGLLQFDFNDTRISLANRGATIRRVLVFDDAGQGIVSRLYIFDSAPTAISDNDAFAIAEADFNKLLGSIEIPASDYLTIGADKIADTADNGLRVESANGIIYGYLVTGGTPTFAAVDDLIITLILERD